MIRNLLAIRLSAMGDVAMTVPVIDSLARRYPDLCVTVLTVNRLVPFFSWMPENVKVKGIKLNDYKGICGLERLFSELKAEKYDAVADLHDVLRTKYLKWRFRMSGVPVKVIDKGRASKKALLGHGITGTALKSSFSRYADVFRDLGFVFEPNFVRAFDNSMEDLSVVWKAVGEKKTGDKWVGIAPFAAHEGKVYPLDKMRTLAECIAMAGCKVFLFGAGKKESALLKTWETQNVMSVCGLMGGLKDEILLMSQLDCMVAMDSANMHMASLVAVPVVSVWGATHPKAGFLGWNQSADNVVQLEMECRPCSVYGNKPCRYGDYRCMRNISNEQIIGRVFKIVGVE